MQDGSPTGMTGTTGDIQRPPLSPALAGPLPSDRKFPNRSAERRAARGVPWRTLVALLFVVAVLVLATPKESLLGPAGLASGSAVALLGEALRIWGCGHLRKNEDVVSSGPYAYVRNPLYIGTLLILVGFCVAAGSPATLYALLPVGVATFVLYYAPKKERIESARLRQRFGARFDRWHDAVPAYVPRLTPWPEATRAPWSARLVAENSELETAAFVLIGIVVMLAGYLS
jgi:protein-S-isoprenylcysteine O-methyltransferase Ste14